MKHSNCNDEDPPEDIAHCQNSKQMDGGELLSFSKQGNNIDLNLDKGLQDSVQVVEQVVNGGYVQEKDEVDRWKWQEDLEEISLLMLLFPLLYKILGT